MLIIFMYKNMQRTTKHNLFNILINKNDIQNLNYFNNNIKYRDI